ncbi:MAG: hypothetical protein ABH838_02335, partial [Actinomycetota bacterium]
MRAEKKIAMIKGVHTAIYVAMVAGTFYIFYCGWTKTYNVWLYVSLVLLTIESAAFFANGMNCPLADLAEKYGAPSGHLGDTFLPDWFTRLTFRLF